jgi:hypothetical protein
VYAAVEATASLITRLQVVWGDVLALSVQSLVDRLRGAEHAVRGDRGIGAGHVDGGDGLVAEHVVAEVRRVERRAVVMTPIFIATWFVEQTEIFSAIARNPELSESRVKL